MNQTYSDFDVLIVGGGMVGMAMACALGDTSLRVGLLDPAAPEMPLGKDYALRTSAITVASQRMLEVLGVWPDMVKQRMGVIREMRVWETRVDEGLHFDSADIGEPCLGHIIENIVTQTALYQGIQRFANVKSLTARLEDMVQQQDAIEITTSTGERYSTRLLIGADGVRSRVRDLAGIEKRGWAFGQKAIVATIKTGKTHRDTAWQRFLDTGPLALLPLDDAYYCSLVWSADTSLAEALITLNDDAFVAAMQQAFGDALGALQVLSPRAAFELTLDHASRYVGPRVALIGDAAHRVHPLAGQGVNLGFSDVGALAEVIVQAQQKDRDVGTQQVLRRYERWRKGDNLIMLATMDGFKRIFGTQQPVVMRLRRLGLGLVNRAEPIKHLFMRRASGLSGDLPRLNRGLSII